MTKGIDAISQATPMLIFRETGEMVSFSNLLLGNVAGSLGETSAILIIIAGIYLIYKKVAAWQTMAGVLIGFTGLSTILYLTGNPQIPNPIFGILSGGIFIWNGIYGYRPNFIAKNRRRKMDIWNFNRNYYGNY